MRRRTHRHTSVPLLAAFLLQGCVAPLSGDADLNPETGKADGAVAALEGTRRGYGVLRLLNDGEGTDVTFLDEVVALDSRAADNLVIHRDGLDGLFGTEDDDLFDSIAEVDTVRWVGPSALERLAEFALENDYVPGDDAILGSFDGIELTYAEAERILAFANTATEDELLAASVPSRSAASILAARPIVTMATLADLYWVGPRTIEHLLAAVAEPVGGEPCHTTADCAEGLRCTGRPWSTDEGPVDTDFGKCRDLTRHEGTQERCTVDSDCNPHLICIGQSVYPSGYCALSWMRDTFTDGGGSGIPSIVMSEPTARTIRVFGQASVAEDILIDIDIEHSDPSSLWIGIKPPSEQAAVTLWNGATMTGPLPTHYSRHSLYRDTGVNGDYSLLVQNVGGRGEGRVGAWSLTITSRWD